MALLGELDIDGSGFNDSIGTMEGKSSAFIGGLGKIGGALALVGVAIAAASGVIAGFGDVLDFGGKLNDLSLATGESAGDMTILGQAFENAGLGSEAAGDFVLKLQDSIAGVNSESGAAAAALAKMGLSADGLRTQTALQQIEALQGGFAKLDQTSKVAAARDIFGKSGGKALALMNDSGAVAQAKEQATPLAMTMEANLEGFDALGDALNGAALSGKEFFAGFLEPLTPFFTDCASALGSVDFTTIGRALGNIASGIVTVFSALWEGLKATFAFVDKLVGGALSKAGQDLGNIGTAIAGKAKIADPNEKKDGKVGDQTAKALPDSQVSALQRIGGGGGFGGGADPLLSESQKQTELLRSIARQGSGRGETAAATPERVPV